ncbi:ALP1-like protein isoform X1 [Tanacetum coccineum]
MLEVVASQDLWIFHAFFGVSGANNDLDVLHHSPLLNDIKDGIAPECPFEVNNNVYAFGYYLGDGIYPEEATFVKAYKHRGLISMDMSNIARNQSKKKRTRERMSDQEAKEIKAEAREIMPQPSTNQRFILRQTSSYYVTHPTSVVDYDDEYQQDDVHNNFEDPLVSAMRQGEYSSRNSGNTGRNSRRAYVQEEVVEGMNAPKETGNVQRTPVETPFSAQYFTVQ